MITVKYLGPLCSPRLLTWIFNTARQKPQLAAQKFHLLLARGLSMHHGTCIISTLSTIPVSPANHHKKLWCLKQEIEDQLIYRYIPMINLPGFKSFGGFLYTFFSLGRWKLFVNTPQKVLVVDVLNLTTALAGVLASKIFNIKSVGIVTDIPGQMIVKEGTKTTVVTKIYSKLMGWTITRFSGYILLTKQMNSVVNPRQKPYLIMEGLVNQDMTRSVRAKTDNSGERIIQYAGGLYSKYGVKSLINAFLRLPHPDIVLELFGTGDLDEYIIRSAQKDSRIRFHGIVPNSVVVESQLKATLLVNPRPPEEEFTKYSFPSKNMEYMASGTAMVTTRLPGMPSEYNPYVLLFDEADEDGMYRSLTNILKKGSGELATIGKKAKDFVLAKKNNRLQAKRVLDFVSEL